MNNDLWNKLLIQLGNKLLSIFGYSQNKEPTKKGAQKLNSISDKPSNNEPENSPTLIPAALCLVVRARVASPFANKPNLSTDEVKQLIDKALYFLCTEAEVDKTQSLELAEGEPIPADSDREVYIRIDIDNAGGMIGKKIIYALKNNLPDGAKCSVTNIACLKNLSGMQGFNR